MSFLNGILVPLFSGIQALLQGFHPLVGVAFWSLPVGVAALYILKWFSNPDAIERVKRKAQAGLLEMRLFNDNLRALFSGLGQVVGHGLGYVGKFLVPILVMAPLMLIVYWHLDGFYGLQGLQVDQPAVLEVTFAEGATDDARPDVELRAPQGLVTETGGLWIPSEREMAWRVSASQEGEYEFEVVRDGETYTKAVTVADGPVRRVRTRGASALVQLLNPGEPPLPAASGIETIRLSYPQQGAVLDTHTWAWIGMLFMTLFALVIKDWVGVTF